MMRILLLVFLIAFSKISLSDTTFQQKNLNWSMDIPESWDIVTSKPDITDELEQVISASPNYDAEVLGIEKKGRDNLTVSLVSILPTTNNDTDLLYAYRRSVATTTLLKGFIKQYSNITLEETVANISGYKLNHWILKGSIGNNRLTLDYLWLKLAKHEMSISVWTDNTKARTEALEAILNSEFRPAVNIKTSANDKPEKNVNPQK